MKNINFIIIIALLSVLLTGCGGGEAGTNNISLNTPTPVVSNSGGSIKLSIKLPFEERNITNSALPYGSKILKITVTGEAITNPLTQEFNNITQTGEGTYSVTVSNIPAGLNVAKVEILSAERNMVAQSRFGFFIKPGTTVDPGIIYPGVGVESNGTCNPANIEIPAGTKLYFQNYDYDNDRTVKINSSAITIGPVVKAKHIVQPLTPESFSSGSYVFNTEGTYTYDTGFGAPGRILVYGNPYSPEMVSITGTGTEPNDIAYQMGQAGVAEPVHSVKISNFHIGKYEVTNGEYRNFDSTKPSDNKPVIYVTWSDSVKYCNWLSSQQGLEMCYTDSDHDGNLDTLDRTKNGYRLATESEWEYACRAGTTTDYYWEENYPSSNIGTYCFYWDNAGSITHPVGEKLPNNWGLYDMSGNVWEWCSDWYDASYGSPPYNDPIGPISGSYRVCRGGSWHDGADYCRSAYRLYDGPVHTNYHVGFRLVRTDTASYLTPSITGFTPGSGTSGDTITINGTNFSNNKENNIVRFNGVYAKTETASSSQITVKVPAGAATGKISVRTPGGTAYSTANFIVTDSSGKMVLIPAGTFQMGDPDGGSGGSNERPRHSVTTTYNFYMSKYEIRNKEYIIYDSNHAGTWTDPNYPVEGITWYDTVNYCNWLSDQECLTRCYDGSYNLTISNNGYRLPTEAEWEYACRAGETTFYDYYWGDSYTPPNISAYCWYYDNSDLHVNISGTKLANNFGLYDMSGNVWEWCNDWFVNYSGNGQTDPVGPDTGADHIIRGGSWDNVTFYCRSAYRHYGVPTAHNYNIGFRIVRRKF